MSTVWPGADAQFDSSSTQEPNPPWLSFNGSDDGSVGVNGLGFAITMLVDGHHQSRPGDVILTTESPGKGGVALVVSSESSVQSARGATFRVSDGNSMFNISTDPVCSAVLGMPGKHFVGVGADAGSRIITIMVDGVLCDGGGQQPFGWKWFPALGLVRGGSVMKVGEHYGGKVMRGHVYSRKMLTTSQMVGNFRNYTMQ